MNDGTGVKGMRGVDLTQMVRGVGGVSVLRVSCRKNGTVRKNPESKRM